MARLISALAWYGPKQGALRDLLIRVQELVAAQVGPAFRPYTLEQVHATLIALDGVVDPGSGVVVNEAFGLNLGVHSEMDLPGVMDLLERRFQVPLAVRFGGVAAGAPVPFLSRGQHLFERSFSVQGRAFVLMGWPAVSLAEPGPGPAGSAPAGSVPVDDVRREMNAAGVLHRYHFGSADVDNDLHLVVGHWAGDDAPAEALARAVACVRAALAEAPVEATIGLKDVKVVASDSRTMAPALYVSAIPADTDAMLALMRSAPVRH